MVPFHTNRQYHGHHINICTEYLWQPHVHVLLVYVCQFKLVIALNYSSMDVYPISTGCAN